MIRKNTIGNREENPEIREWNRKLWRLQQLMDRLTRVLWIKRTLSERWEIKRIFKIIDTDWLTESDLKFLEGLSISDLSEIGRFNKNRVNGIYHYMEKYGVVDEDWHPYTSKYAFLYEISRDKPLISEQIKTQLKEKARKEIWKRICSGIIPDTFAYQLEDMAWFYRYIFEYIPQKVVANKMRWTGNNYVTTYIDNLWPWIEYYYDELDDDYKKQIKKEYDERRNFYDRYGYGVIDWGQQEKNEQRFNEWVEKEWYPEYKSSSAPKQ